VPSGIGAEAYLAGVAGYTGGVALPTLALAAALGQMAAKTLYYYAGRGAVRLRRLARHAERLEAMRRRLEARRRSRAALLLASSFVGLPPFMVVSATAGALRIPLATFLVCGTIGRYARFALVLAAPGAILELFG
jgi:membrane protein YqaA with SNARE-associated domain